MAPKSTLRQTTTVLLVALLIAGMGAVGAGQTSTGDVTAAQETTTVGGESPAVSIQNLSAPSQVQVGTNFTVTAEIANQGGTEEIRQVTYLIAGNVIGSTSVQLSPDATETVVFNVSAADTSGFPTGTFTHGVFTDGAEATANLTLTGAGETETQTGGETPTQTAETTTATAGTATTTTAVTTQTTEPTATPTGDATTTAATTTTTPAAQTASLTFEDQNSNGSAVTLQSVTVPEGGFVVIHDNGVVEGEVVESMLGTSDYLDAGTQRNVTVQLDQPLNQSQELVAVVYRDSNDNREFDFVTSNRTADGPYRKVDSREAVNAIAVVDVNEGTTNESA